ncbi:vesicle-associated protein 1-3-like [Papaver somniferum]|uniref:vesicle-associated protein 1-3-like n=1 Tax=Papaver somniferum TaxID=3469 RepID=UPI000E6F6478|nr:vesicle-associated protein 1-3-like [Papaver somniferum]
MSAGNLSNMQPPKEFKFPFELNKQTSYTLQFTNKTDEYAAFSVKTTDPKKYCVFPSVGIVSPRTVCNVTIVMQAQKKAPKGMQCKDEILVESVALYDMFDEGSAQVTNMEDMKFRVIYVPANQGSEQALSKVTYVPHSPLQQGSTTKAASCVDNGSPTTCLFDDIARSICLCIKRMFKGKISCTVLMPRQ